MKKKMIALLAMMTTLVLSACGGGSDEDAAFSAGTTYDTYYENTFFGVRYTPSQGLKMQDEDYIKQLNALVDDVLSDTSVKSSLDEGGSMTVAAASNDDNTLTFNVAVQNMKSVFRKVVTEDFIIESSLDVTKETLESAGIFDSVTVSKGTATFLGEDHVSMDVLASVNGVTLYQKSVVLRKGSYAATFTAAGISESDPQTILNDVTAIE